MRIEDIVKVIDEAFDDVPYPDNHNITGPDDGDLEAAEVAEHFRGKHWRDIDLSFLKFDNGAEIPLLEPQAYKFFLPAYLIICLRHGYDADMIIEFLLDSLLSVPSYPHSRVRKIFFDRCGDFTAKQKKAVRLFLEYLRNNIPDYGPNGIDGRAIEALNDYWGDQ